MANYLFTQVASAAFPPSPRIIPAPAARTAHCSFVTLLDGAGHAHTSNGGIAARVAEGDEADK